MYSLNRAQIIGNVTRDPELRQTSGGQAVATFAVATNRVWTDKMGQKQEQADFHNLVVWGKLAEICQQYVKKGRKIYAEGRMQTRDWTGEDGVKRYRTEIVVENLILLDRTGSPSEQNAEFQSQAGTAPAREMASQNQAGSNSAPNDDEISLDDLPF